MTLVEDATVVAPVRVEGFALVSVKTVEPFSVDETENADRFPTAALDSEPVVEVDTEVPSSVVFLTILLPSALVLVVVVRPFSEVLVRPTPLDDVELSAIELVGLPFAIELICCWTTLAKESPILAPKTDSIVRQHDIRKTT